MAGSFNTITIVGYAGRDPEGRYLPSGEEVADVSIATTERRKGQDGAPHEATTWFRVSAFGTLAGSVLEYVKKGSYVYVAGPLTQREYTDRAGQQRTALEVRARDVRFLDRAAEQPAAPTRTIAAAPMDMATDLDDVPF